MDEVSKRIEELNKLVGQIINYELAKIAISCSAYAKEEKTISQDSLAILGDHIIKLLLSSSQFHSNNNIIKKDLHRYVDYNGQNKKLETIAKRLAIDSILLQTNTDLRGNKKRATSLEAIFGAIFLSNGFEAAKAFADKIKLLD